MKVVFLGTGGTYPSKTRNVASVVVQVGPDVIMFDCGEGTQRQLTHSNVSFMRIRAIFVTHLHADHFLGITGLVQSMSLNGREEPLKVVGPRGTCETVRDMLNLGYFESQFDVSRGWRGVAHCPCASIPARGAPPTGSIRPPKGS
jgi:ribonuclease Z